MAWEDTTAPQFGGHILTRKDMKDAGGIAPQNQPVGPKVPIRVPGTATAGDFESLVAAEQAEMRADTQKGM